MTTIDIIILIILGLMAIRGLTKGLIRELFSFGSLILGLLAAMAFYKSLGGYITEQFGKNGWNDGISFFIIFIVVFIVLKLVERTILKLIDDTAALSIDKSLGFILGLMEGIIICSLITYLLDLQTLFNTDKLLGNSFFVPYLSKIFPFLKSAGSAVIDSIKK